MSIDMFLTTVATKVAVDAIYYVTRLIRHRLGLSGPDPQLIVEGLENEPSPEAVRLAKIIVKEIEDETKSSLDRISPDAATTIVSQLEQLAKERYNEGGSIDKARGKILLQELRKLPHL